MKSLHSKGSSLSHSQSGTWTYSVSAVFNSWPLRSPWCQALSQLESRKKKDEECERFLIDQAWNLAHNTYAHILLERTGSCDHIYLQERLEK